MPRNLIVAAHNGQALQIAGELGLPRTTLRNDEWMVTVLGRDTDLRGMRFQTIMITDAAGREAYFYHAKFNSYLEELPLRLLENGRLVRL